MLDCFLFSCHVKGIIQLSACPKTHSFIPSFFSVFSTSSPRILILVCLAANPVLCPSSTSCDTLPGRLLEGSHLPVLCAYGNHTNCLLTALPSFCLEAGDRILFKVVRTAGQFMSSGNTIQSPHTLDALLRTNMYIHESQKTSSFLQHLLSHQSRNLFSPSLRFVFYKLG